MSSWITAAIPLIMEHASSIDKLEHTLDDVKGDYLLEETAHVRVEAGRDDPDIIISADHEGDGNELKRELKSRHASMLAIGGAIGTGLVIGSGVGLARGGPVSKWRISQGRQYDPDAKGRPISEPKVCSLPSVSWGLSAMP